MKKSIRLASLLFALLILVQIPVSASTPEPEFKSVGSLFSEFGVDTSKISTIGVIQANIQSDSTSRSSSSSNSDGTGYALVAKYEDESGNEAVAMLSFLTEAMTLELPDFESKDRMTEEMQRRSRISGNSGSTTIPIWQLYPDEIIYEEEMYDYCVYMTVSADRTYISENNSYAYVPRYTTFYIKRGNEASAYTIENVEYGDDLSGYERSRTSPYELTDDFFGGYYTFETLTSGIFNTVHIIDDDAEFEDQGYGSSMIEITSTYGAYIIQYELNFSNTPWNLPSTFIFTSDVLDLF